MTIICPKCRRFTRTKLDHVVQMLGGDTGPAEFRRCLNCGGLAVVRQQTARGRDGAGQECFEASGEIDGRTQADPQWYPAALMRGIG